MEIKNLWCYRVGVWRDAKIRVLRAGYRLLPACDGQPSRSRNPALSDIFVKFFRLFLFWFSFVLFFQYSALDMRGLGRRTWEVNKSCPSAVRALHLACDLRRGIEKSPLPVMCLLFFDVSANKSFHLVIEFSSCVFVPISLLSIYCLLYKSQYLGMVCWLMDSKL